MAASGKCFVVTGPPGVGKTTLIMRVVDKLKASNPKSKFQGFYTSEVREGGERVGFQVVTLDGRQGPLASAKTSTAETVRWPTVGRYKVDVASFESLALPELQLGINEDTRLFILDEVGKMELFSPLFFPAVLKILESNVPILASIPIAKQGRDIPEVAKLRNHPGTTVFSLDANNRNAVTEQIYNALSNLLRKG
ncbi:unnamed protein product [Rhodiola kirilowii]